MSTSSCLLFRVYFLASSSLFPRLYFHTFTAVSLPPVMSTLDDPNPAVAMANTASLWQSCLAAAAATDSATLSSAAPRPRPCPCPCPLAGRGGTSHKMGTGGAVRARAAVSS